MTASAAAKCRSVAELIDGCRAAIEGLRAGDDLQYFVGALQGCAVRQQGGAGGGISDSEAIGGSDD
jgi:hypothetical protein